MCVPAGGSNSSARVRPSVRKDDFGPAPRALSRWMTDSTTQFDGTLVVNDGGIFPVRQRTRAVALTAGLHSHRVEYFADTGAAGLILSWSGARIVGQIVPASRLFHATAAIVV